jgi:hypothetical protein
MMVEDLIRWQYTSLAAINKNYDTEEGRNVWGGDGGHKNGTREQVRSDRYHGRVSAAFIQ